MRFEAALFWVRYWVLAAVVGLGLTAPWDRWVDMDAGRTTWLAIAAWLARAGWLGFSAATIAVLVVGIVFAAAAAGLRVWGAAVPRTHGRGRNAQLLGVIVHVVALAMIMPPSGAGFAVAVTTGLVAVWMRQSFAEENPAGHAGWGWAVLAEIYWVGVAGSFAVAGWRYNAFLLIKCVVVALGVSLVVRAMTMGRARQLEPGVGV